MDFLTRTNDCDRQTAEFRRPDTTASIHLVVVVEIQLFGLFIGYKGVQNGSTTYKRFNSDTRLSLSQLLKAAAGPAVDRENNDGKKDPDVAEAMN